MDSAARRRRREVARSARAWRRWLAVVGAVLLAVGVPLTVTAAGPSDQVATAVGTGTDTTSAPPASSVETTVPSSEPATSTSEPATTSVDETVVGAGETGEGVNTAALVLGLVGLVALVGVAAWWMVRRDDEDERPHPHEPPPVSDLI